MSPRTGRAAIVTDDLASANPRAARAVEERDTTEVLADQKPLIRIHAERSSHGNSKLAFA